MPLKQADHDLAFHIGLAAQGDDPSERGGA